MNKATVIYDDSKRECKELHVQVKSILVGYSKENAARMQRLGVTCMHCKKTFHNPSDLI